jgi:hypothetical protein
MTNEENTAMMNGIAEAEAFAATEPMPVETTVEETPIAETTPQPTIEPVPTITVSEVLRLLNEGYSRTTKDKSYDASIGCIGDYYGFSDVQVKSIFTHPSLKGRKTKRVVSRVPLVNIIDDTVTESDVNNN